MKYLVHFLINEPYLMPDGSVECCPTFSSTVCELPTRSYVAAMKEINSRKMGTSKMKCPTGREAPVTYNLGVSIMCDIEIAKEEEEEDIYKEKETEFLERIEAEVLEVELIE
jgi:hypothetical protein